MAHLARRHHVSHLTARYEATWRTASALVPLHLVVAYSHRFLGPRTSSAAVAGIRHVNGEVPVRGPDQLLSGVPMQRFTWHGPLNSTKSWVMGAQFLSSDSKCSASIQYISCGVTGVPGLRVQTAQAQRVYSCILENRYSPITPRLPITKK